MKKYFSEFLPVPGEIKEGDRIMNSRNGVVLTGNISKRELSELLPSDKKVKLFLCSRDIQVGDKFTQKGIDIVHPTARFTCSAYNEEEEWIMDDEGKKYASQTVYKVIGEILTPGIREGQEFTEKEVEYLTIGDKIT